MIKLTKGMVGFDAVKWAILALDLKDKHNATYRHVFVLNNKMYATNGHRQHVAALTADFPKAHGAYSIAVNTAREIVLLPSDAQAPSFDRVIPAIKGGASIAVEPTMSRFAALIRAMPEPWSLNYDYFKEAAAATDTCTVCMTSGTPILRFDARSGNIAVVMPLRA